MEAAFRIVRYLKAQLGYGLFYRVHSLSQMKYGLDILEETSLIKAKPIETPMDPSVKLCVDQGNLLSSSNSYRKLVVN